MKQHSVPQEIMSVEFNLFGSMNIRQFGYVAAAGGLAYTLYLILPGFLKWIGAGVSIIVGLALAFLPGFSGSTSNFLLALRRPTRRVWKKSPNPPAFLSDVPGALKSYGRVKSFTAQKRGGEEGSAVYSSLSKEEESSKELLEVDRELERMQKELNAQAFSKQVKESFGKVGEESEGSANPIINLPNVLNGHVIGFDNSPKANELLIVKDSFEKPVFAIKTNSKGIFISNTALPLGKYSVTLERNGKVLEKQSLVVNGNVLPFMEFKAN